MTVWNTSMLAGKEMGKCRRSIFFSALGLFLFALTALFVAMRREIGPYDEGLILVGAVEIASGHFPHRDFYANYGPGQFALAAAFFKFFGTSVLSERLADIITKALIVPVIYRLCRNVSSQSTSLITSLVTLLWLCAEPFHGYPVWPALLLGLASILCLDRADNKWICLLGGILSGLAILFRYDMGVATVGALAAVVIWRAVVRRNTGVMRAVAIALMPYISGVALLVLPLCYIYARNDVIQDWYFQIVVFPVTSYPIYRSLPFPSIWNISSDLACYIPFVTFLALAFTCSNSLRSSTLLQLQQSWTLAFSSALALVLIPKGLVRTGALSMIPAIFMSFVILAALHARALKSASYSHLRLRVLLVVIVVFAAIPTLVAAIGMTTNLTGTFTRLASGTAPPSPSSLVRASNFEIDSGQFSAVQFIKEHTTADEPIFVGNDRHDRIFANDVLFYFLADRSPATKWYHFDPGLQTTAAIQSQMIDELRRNKVRYVVLTSQFDGVTEPNKSAISSGVFMLDDFIRKEYSVVDSFSSYTILKKNVGDSFH